MTRRWLAIAILLLTACASETSAVRSTPVPTTAAKRAPDFTLATFDGEEFTLSDHFGELPIVLNFWAPW